jgi:hypothetical protein
MAFIKKYWWAILLLLIAVGAAIYWFYFRESETTAVDTGAAGGGSGSGGDTTYTGGEWNQGNVQYLDPSELTYMLPENWVPPGVITRVNVGQPLTTQSATFNL